MAIAFLFLCVLRSRSCPCTPASAGLCCTQSPRLRCGRRCRPRRCRTRCCARTDPGTRTRTPAPTSCRGPRGCFYYQQVARGHCARALRPHHQTLWLQKRSETEGLLCRVSPWLHPSPYWVWVCFGSRLAPASTGTRTWCGVYLIHQLSVQRQVRSLKASAWFWSEKETQSVLFCQRYLSEPPTLTRYSSCLLKLTLVTCEECPRKVLKPLDFSTQG